MKTETTRTTLIQLDEEEVSTLNKAYNIMADLINTMKKEYGEGLADSRFNELHFEELKTTMLTLDCLVDMADDDILELF